MAVAFAAKLLDHVVEAKGQQCPARNPRKPAADFIAQGDTAPCDQKSQGCGEQDVSKAGEHGDQQRFRLVPLLHPRGKHEGQPMSGDGGVKEGHGKTRYGDGGEYFGIHRWTIPLWLSLTPVSWLPFRHAIVCVVRVLQLMTMVTLMPCPCDEEQVRHDRTDHEQNDANKH